MGRTGKYFAFQHYGVEPDIMTTAKALGCGVPVGAFALNEKAAAASLAPGDHGTTYGGNPLAVAAVSKVFDLFEENRIVDHVVEISACLEERLMDLAERSPYIKEVRGMGLMRGLQLQDKPVGDVVKQALSKGLVVISAGSDVLRLVPPLIIEKEHVDQLYDILSEILL